MSLMMQRLWIQLTADRKRFGVLCAMLGVGLLLWARVIVVTNIPRTAVATEERQQVAADVQRHLRSDIGTANQPGRERVPIELDLKPERNPFVISTEHFPKPIDVTKNPDDPAKSDWKHDEEDIDLLVRQRREHLARAAATLKLEAVMTGAELAVISGRTFRLGDEVPSRGDRPVRFILTSVKPRAVVLELEGHEFELALPTPR
jgi:hypothetical protein